MKVSVQDFDVNMVLGNNGVTMQVHDNRGKYMGKLRLGKSKIEWCKGKQPIGRGVKRGWKDLAGWFEVNGA